MPKVSRPEWGAEVNRVLFKFNISKVKLAKMLEVNYTEMCNVILGYRINPTMQEQILTKIIELEQEARRAV